MTRTVTKLGRRRGVCQEVAVPHDVQMRVMVPVLVQHQRLAHGAFYKRRGHQGRDQ